MSGQRLTGLDHPNIVCPSPSTLAFLFLTWQTQEHPLPFQWPWQWHHRHRLWHASPHPFPTLCSSFHREKFPHSTTEKQLASLAGSFDLVPPKSSKTLTTENPWTSCPQVWSLPRAYTSSLLSRCDDHHFKIELESPYWNPFSDHAKSFTEVLPLSVLSPRPGGFPRPFAYNYHLDAIPSRWPLPHPQTKLEQTPWTVPGTLTCFSTLLLQVGRACKVVGMERSRSESTRVTHVLPREKEKEERDDLG